MAYSTLKVEQNDLSQEVTKLPVSPILIWCLLSSCSSKINRELHERNRNYSFWMIYFDNNSVSIWPQVSSGDIQCICKKGFHGNGEWCQANINYCALDNGGCDPERATCTYEVPSVTDTVQGEIYIQKQIIIQCFILWWVAIGLHILNIVNFLYSDYSSHVYIDRCVEVYQHIQWEILFIPFVQLIASKGSTTKTTGPHQYILATFSTKVIWALFLRK